jgi:hypothetical protein
MRVLVSRSRLFNRRVASADFAHLPCRKPIALPRESVFAKAPALSQGITPVSGWLAPYGASSVPCNGLRPVVPNDIPLKGNRPRRVVPEVTPPFTFGSHSQQPKASPAPRFTAAASCISAASRASALSRLASATPRTGLAPTHRCRGRCAMKPRSAPELKRWGAQGMHCFRRSSAVARSASPCRLQIRRVSLSAHHGHRIASADSCATRVVCDGRGFASRLPKVRGLGWRLHVWCPHRR